MAPSKFILYFSVGMVVECRMVPGNELTFSKTPDPANSGSGFIYSIRQARARPAETEV